MTKEELLEAFTGALKDMTYSGIEIERISQAKNMLAIYLRMFGETPHFVSTDYDMQYCCIEDDDAYDGIDPYKTLKNYAEKYSDSCVIIRNFDTRFIIADHLLMCCDEDSIYGCYNKEFFPLELKECIVKSTEENIKYMQYVTSGGNGFSTMEMEVKKQDCDIETNYNDDIPYNQVLDFINGDESGLVIWYGIPGGGNFIKNCA